MEPPLGLLLYHSWRFRNACRHTYDEFGCIRTFWQVDPDFRARIIRGIISVQSLAKLVGSRPDGGVFQRRIVLGASQRLYAYQVFRQLRRTPGDLHFAYEGQESTELLGSGERFAGQHRGQGSPLLAFGNRRRRGPHNGHALFYSANDDS